MGKSTGATAKIVAEGLHEAEQHIMERQGSNYRVGLRTHELVHVCHHIHGQFKIVAGSVDAR